MKSEMGGASGTYGREESDHRGLAGESEAKRAIWRPGSRWKDSIEKDFHW